MTVTSTFPAEKGIRRKARWTLPICLAHEFTENKTLKDLRFGKLYPVSWASVRLARHVADLSGVSSQTSRDGASEEPDEWEMLFPTGPYLFELFLFPSSEMSAADAFGLPSTLRRNMIILVSDFHYPWVGNSCLSFMWVLGPHDIPM